MKDLDARIRNLLAAEDARAFEEFGAELPIHSMVIETFRGQARWLAVLTMVISLVFFGLCIYSTTRVFAAEATRDLIIWSLATMFFLVGVMAMKVWFWMEMNKVATTRELKRIEFQLAQLTSRVGALTADGGGDSAEGTRDH